MEQPSNFVLFLILFAAILLMIGLIWGVPALLENMQAKRKQRRRSGRRSFQDTAGVAALLPPEIEQAQQQGPTVALSAAEQTRKAVSRLPASVPWLLRDVRPDHIPFMADEHGHMHALSLKASEHAVICGASGGGKGNVIQLIGLSALYLGPQEVEVWFIDAKQGLDYSFATRIEHARLYADVRDPESGKLLSDYDLSQGFTDAIAEMDRRNVLMFNKARNVHEYCAKTGVKLPIILVVVDEAAELSREQKAQLDTIARKGRASGIVLITSTQYPTRDVLSGQVQTNSLNRICLKLSSSKDTLVALSASSNDELAFEPSAIVPSGVAVFKSKGGKQALGKVPEITDELRDKVISYLEGTYPREASTVSRGQAAERTNIPVRHAEAQNTGDQPESTYRGMIGTGAIVAYSGIPEHTSRVGHTKAVLAGVPATLSLDQQVKDLQLKGWSPSRIAMESGLFRGEKGKRLEQVKAVLGIS